VSSALIDREYAHANTTPSRVPFCDLYDTIADVQVAFQARLLRRQRARHLHDDHGRTAGRAAHSQDPSKGREPLLHPGQTSAAGRIGAAHTEVRDRDP
jgi:hypothetical protein